MCTEKPDCSCFLCVIHRDLTPPTPVTITRAERLSGPFVRRRREVIHQDVRRVLEREKSREDVRRSIAEKEQTRAARAQLIRERALALKKEEG